MVLRQVAQYVHHPGIKFHFYLDDFLIHLCNPAILVKHLNYVADPTSFRRLHTHLLQFFLLNQWYLIMIHSQLEFFQIRWSVWICLGGCLGTSPGAAFLSAPGTYCHVDDRCIIGWVGHESDCTGLCLLVSGKWPSSYEGRSIISLELESVLLALHNLAGHLHQVVPLVLSDNTMTVSYLTHSALLCGQLWEIGRFPSWHKA